MSDRVNADVIYDIENVIKQIETATDVKMKVANQFDPEYISMGQITEENLTDLGFEFVDYSSNIKCPIYKLGKNIEAIFDDTILHIYDLNSHI